MKSIALRYMIFISLFLQIVNAETAQQVQLQSSNYLKLDEYYCRTFSFETNNEDPLNYQIDFYGHKRVTLSQPYFPYLQKFVKIYQDKSLVAEFFSFDNYGGRELNFDKENRTSILNWGSQEFYRFESINIDRERGQFIFLAPGYTLYCKVNQQFRINEEIEIRMDIKPPQTILNFEHKRDSTK